MKRRLTCSFGLLLTLVPLVTAQLRVLPPPSLSCNGFINRVEWGSQFRFDACHTGYNPYEAVLSPANVGNLVLNWKYATGGDITYSSPTVANGVVYIGSGDGNLYALDSQSGALVWKYATGDSVDSAPAVANGMVYFASQNTLVYALKADTGARVWVFPTGCGFGPSPTVANGVVYVTSCDNNLVTNLYALNANTGALIWKYATDYYLDTNPAVAAGVVYFGSGNGNVYALNAANGVLLWKYATAGGITGQAVANGVVYVESDYPNPAVYALDSGIGALLWKYTSGSRWSSSPAVANGVMYAPSLDGNLYALNTSTGALLWARPVGGAAVQCPPTVANHVVYVASVGGVYSLDAEDGTLLGKYTTGGGISSPAIADGVVYVGSLDYNVYAFHLSPQ
jgi:eukaryotic-like serine/threonine-protein kinase